MQVLSQDEIDALLTAIDPNGVPPKDEIDALLAGVDLIGIDVPPFFAAKKADSKEKHHDDCSRSISLKKPTLGLEPRWLHEESRLNRLHESMMKKKDAGEAVPIEWLDEYCDLMIQKPPR